MIAFDKTLLHNTFLVDVASNLNSRSQLSINTLKVIKQQVPYLKSNNNVLLRIGFFLLGGLLFLSVMGLLAWMIFGGGNSSDFTTIIYFGLCSAIGIIACEVVSKDQYRFGIDDAFIVGTIGCLYGFVSNLVSLCCGSELNYNSDLDLYQIYTTSTMTAIGLIACLRYCNFMCALFSVVMLTATFYILTAHFNGGIQYLPFLMMFSAVSYFFIFLKLYKINTVYFYSSSLFALKSFALLLFYFSGNYLVVRSLSESLFNTQFSNEQDIPFSLLFWMFTFIVPALYLYWSINKKDKVFLNIGFLTFCFSIFTFRFYHQVLPVEIALTFGGFILFVFTFLVIKRIRNKTSGITFRSDKNESAINLTNIEALIINSHVNQQTNEINNPMEFGGGGFSGGGAGESF